MAQVLNSHEIDVTTPNTVYIGRPSKWGNPFVIGTDGTREEVVQLYADWIETTDLILDLWELEGKDLICWCAPQACHGDVLLRLVAKYYGSCKDK